MIVSSWQEQVSADSAPGAPMKAPTQDVWRALESKGGMAMVGQSSVSIPLLQNGFGMFWDLWQHFFGCYWMFFVCLWLAFNGFNMFWIVLGIFGDPVRDQEI